MYSRTQNIRTTTHKMKFQVKGKEIIVGDILVHSCMIMHLLEKSSDSPTIFQMARGRGHKFT